MNKRTKLNIFLLLKRALKRYDALMEDGRKLQPNKENVDFWKQRIFYFTLTGLIVVGVPLILYGSYLFLREEKLLPAIFEILLFLTIIVIEYSKIVSVGFKKQFLIFFLYLIGVFLLFNASIFGSGMIIVVVTMILASCMLDKKQNRRFIIINLMVFTLITILLFLGWLDGTPLILYKGVWMINSVTAQGCGIMLAILTSYIYRGLERQAHLIRKSQASLAQSEESHKAMIRNISDAILIVDRNGFVLYHSPNFKDRFPWMREDMLKASLFDRFHPDDLEYIKNSLQSILEQKGNSRTMEIRYINNDEIGYLEMTAVNLLEDASIQGILINCRDITERRYREEQIMYLYQHDPLTGLYNRASFEIELRRLDSKRYFPLSVIVGDINGLKVINDSLGHAEGDKLLVSMRDILNKCCREKDIVARLGGDEFSILLPNTDKETAQAIIQNIYQTCEDYNKSISREIYQISISLGAATKTDIKESMINVIKIAEDHMYKRKLLEGRSYHSSVIASVKTALFEKSYETERHAQRLVHLTKAVGKAIGLSRQQFDELELLSTLHDIGKIGIDNQILNKPGALNDEEWKKMKKHSDIGYRIAMASPELMSIANYILTHHERWDGNGYPQGLSDESIPLLSRILAVADAYDAMTEDRPYRKGMPKKAALQEIINHAGTQFDPKIAEIFIEIIKEDIAKEEGDSLPGK